MKFYGHPLSGNAHRVQALLDVLKLDYEHVIVDLSSGAHKQADFLAVNPLGQVPALQDGDETLRDSTAILVYIARKYDATNQWLPVDPAGAARVQEWLSTAVNEVMAGPATMRAIGIFGTKTDNDAVKAKTDALFDTLFEPRLSGNDWLAADTPTIADLACYSYVARVTEGDYTLDAYPGVRAWLARVEALENITPMGHAAEIMAAAK